jgi:hypothetical protein
MVTGKVPTLAVLVAVNVSVLVLAVLVGLKEAVTPVGKPEAAKLTLPLKPFCGVTVMVLVPFAPRKTLRLPGDAEITKLPLMFTVRAIVVVLVKRPEVPVTVTLTAPTAALELDVNVKVLVLEVLGGLNEAVTPAGKPEADKLTLPVKPFSGVTETVLEPLAPCTMLRLPGVEERKKPGTGPPVGQLFTKLVAFRVPMPVAKSQPVVVPYAGLKELLEVESTPCVPGPDGS